MGGIMEKTDLEKYLKVKTGQDLLNLDVVPKTSSIHLSLITILRLQAIRDEIRRGITEEMLGSWIPVITADPVIIGPEVTNPELVRQYARPGLRVRGTGISEENDLRGLEGRVVDNLSNGNIAVEWDTDIPRGHNLRGSIKSTRGWYTQPQALALLLPEAVTVPGGLRLADDVVADATLGHRVRFTHGYKGRVEGYDGSLDISEHATGMLVQSHPRKKALAIKLDQPVGQRGKLQNVTISLDALEKTLYVSSLGQLDPLDQEQEVRKQAVQEFFPRTRFAQTIAEKALLTMLMGRDMIFYGPAGAGKSSLGRDILRIAQQQELAFTVEGCQVQCNPFSLFDPHFAAENPACPECMIRYDGDFKRTGLFRNPKPDAVKVTSVKLGEAHGIEFIEGTTRIRGYHLAGHKIPKLDGTTTPGRESDFDPEGYHAGLLPRTNNGYLLIEEADKLKTEIHDMLLEALENNRVKPDQLRFSEPAHTVVLMTANDPSVFLGPLRDRTRMIHIPYPADRDTSYGITRVAYHGERPALGAVEIPDTHGREGNGLRRVPIAVPLERAVDGLYIRFRAEQDIAKRDQTLGTNRCKFDALDAARAKLLFDQQFHADTPVIPDLRYLAAGFLYAVETRMPELDVQKRQGEIEQLATWVNDALPKLIAEEENAWWCGANKHIAVASTRVPKIAEQYAAELRAYERDAQAAVRAYNAVRAAYDTPKDERLERERVHYPFMDYLFREQPVFRTATEPQRAALITYFIESRARALPAAPGDAA